jgi:hypothetical protein
MAYNINDCAELRWGAPEGSEEALTCKRRASEAQRQKNDGIPRLVQRAPPRRAGKSNRKRHQASDSASSLIYV